jgi:hypothetical protein
MSLAPDNQPEPLAQLLISDELSERDFVAQGKTNDGRSLYIQFRTITPHQYGRQLTTQVLDHPNGEPIACVRWATPNLPSTVELYSPVTYPPIQNTALALCQTVVRPQ